MARDYLSEYENQQSILIRNQEALEKLLQDAIESYSKIEASDVDKKEIRLNIARQNIARRQNALNIITDKLRFIRPGNEEDTIYRGRQYDEFSKKIENLVSDDLPLRFHGCPIYTAERIIFAGELSSSVDRLGIETSYDVSDQVSVTTRKTIETTVRGYADLAENQSLPAGCIFVLLPKDEMDARAGDSMLMGNVNFKQNPERLYAIITTPENFERVCGWCNANGVSSSKVYDYDDFIKLFDKQDILTEGSTLGK